ncbi:RNA polymerase sigma factor [Planctomycetaceae bacterium SH139]
MTQFPETRATLLANVKSAENREAWGEFVVIYRPVIYRMARRRGMQDADAQDVAQDVLVRIAGAIADYEQKEGIRFRHWLRRIARNAILSAITRSPQDAAKGGTAAADLLVEQTDAAPGLDVDLEKEHRRELYLRAAGLVRTDVNAETWQAFEMTVVQGQSCEDVANHLGKSVGTVYAARSRIIKRLRDRIQRMEESML